MAQRAHVMQAVHQLDDKHARVLAGGYKELAQTFSVALRSAVLQVAELGNALDQKTYFFAELGFYCFRLNVGIFYTVVQKACRNCLCTHAEAREPFGGLYQVHKIRLSAESFVVFVRLGGKIICLLYKSQILLSRSTHPGQYFLNTLHSTQCIIFECQLKAPRNQTLLL